MEGKRKRKPRPKKERLNPILCVWCGVDVLVHARCDACGILVHLANDMYTCSCGMQHGVVSSLRDRQCLDHARGVTFAEGEIC